MKRHRRDSGTYCKGELNLGMQNEGGNRQLRGQADRIG